MLYSRIAFIFFIVSAVSLFSQRSKEHHNLNTRFNTVFAQSGLNIREAPDLSSGKIGLIPFGEKIQFIDKDHFGYQKLDSIITESKSYLIDGLWAKIRYKELEGYILTTFLYNPYSYENESNFGDYVILRPGSGCSDNIHNIHAYNWYGLYQNNHKSTLKKITFEYYNTLDRMTNMQIITKTDKNLFFIIGSKKELPTFEGKIIATISNNQPKNYEPYPCDTTYLITKNLISEYSVEHKDGDFGDHILYVKNKKQWHKIHPFEGSNNYPKRVDFVGDIDSDGIDDFIIIYEGKPGFTILFLSTEALKGNIFKDVACFYSTYCC